MRLKIFAFLILFLSLFFVFNKNIIAQVSGNNVGPELPDAGAGQAVVCDKGFTGTVAVINDLSGNPHNTAPCAKVILRIEGVTAGAAKNPQKAIEFANKLNSFDPAVNGGFPAGTLIVFGVELNNQDAGAWDNPGGNVKQAAVDYAKLYVAFASVINQAKKYQVAPAPPDLYNGVYSGTDWVDSFASAISPNCNLVNTLVADIFKLDGVADWKTKYLYEQKICGKTVTHFEGWGSDPHKSIKEQVDFLKIESLPPGVSTGTTLIVNNCGGFAGSGIGAGTTKPWLYWIPSTPDKVYNADGSEFDYLTCSAVKKPYVLQDIPCDATTDNSEFHELRPYPASPCKKKVADTTLLCGNDLVIKKTLSVQPGGDCTTDANGTKTCKYTNIPQQSSVAINLASAKLPIMGNTDDVANATTNASSIDMLARLNNYVSWYLNGTVNMTWEDDLSQISKNELVKRVVNYSGPLNKLLPWRIKMGERIQQVADALAATDPNNPNARHNQVAVCSLTGTPVPCTKGVSVIQQILTLGGLRLNRFSDWNGHKPPWEEAFKTIEEWSKEYIEWQGGHCTPSVNVLGHQFYACDLAITGGLNFFSQYISYLLPTTTEDRRGLIGTDTNTIKTATDPVTGKSVGTTELAHTIQSDSQVSQVSFVPVDYVLNGVDSSKHSLYFSHTQEDAQLAKLLQDTFRPSTDPGYSGKDSGPDNPTSFYDVASHQHCEIQDIRTNPGDKLYGDINKTDEYNVKDEPIKGTLSFNATFTCVFKPNPDGTYSDCKKDVLASLAIFTKTPNAQENWERLVGGTMSVFKRFFPKVGPNSVLTEIKEIPAVTNVGYSSSTGGDTVLAGAAGSGRDGGNAQIFFPYVGSLQEYFLQGIQKALRPKQCTTNGTGGDLGNASSSASSDAALTPVSGGQGGWLITTTADANNLVASQPGEYGQGTCAWGQSNNLAYSINASFQNGSTPVGPIGSGGKITNYSLPGDYNNYRSFWIDSAGSAHIGLVPKNLSGIKFIITGVVASNAEFPTHLGPEPRTILGLSGNKLYLMALKATTPDGANQAMIAAGATDTLMLDSDTSTYLCQKDQKDPLVKGGGTPIANIGIKGKTDTPTPSIAAGNNICTTPSSTQTTSSPSTSKPGSCQINCDQTISDSAIPASYRGAIKAHVADLANRWVGKTGKNYVNECYNDVVKRSIDARVNPIFSLALWLHESGGSNYSSNITSCITQDFGINGGGVPSADFSAQLASFLKLPNGYKSSHPQCFTPNYTDMQNFIHIYRSGAGLNNNGVCGPTEGDLNYDLDIKEIWGWITNGYINNCSYPSYPTTGLCN